MPQFLGIFDTIGPVLAVIIALFLVIILLRLFIKLLSRLFRPRHSSKNSTIGVPRQFTASSETFNHYAITNKFETKTKQVWRFLLERFDENGNQLPFTTVEMKAKKFSGFIAEGHKVEIFEKVKPGRLITPKLIYNHTANTYVKAN